MQMLIDLMRSGHITGAQESNANPSSFDVCVGSECYRVEGIVQPHISEPVRSILGAVNAHRHALNQPMEVGVSYLAKLREGVKLPSTVYGYCNPKSSTGRNNVHCRVVADGVPRFDAITPAGHHAQLWVAITPKSYPVIIPAGTAVAQTRLFTANTRFSEVDLEVMLAREELVYSRMGKPLRYRDLKITDRDGSILLTLDLESKWIGYRSRRPSRVLDFSKRGYRWEDYYERLTADRGMLRLHMGEFYVLSTHEYVRVPPQLSCEMVDMDSRTGEFRSHYAGYIDSGWGYGRNGKGKGRPITLELCPFEDLVIRCDQPIAKIRFERMAVVPDQHYDELLTSHYCRQHSARLSKHFA